MSTCAVLPSIIELEKYNGDYFAYEAAIYNEFVDDFVSSKPIFQGQALALKRYPVYKEKEATFWHIVGDGPDEKNKLPDLRRYERIKWPKFIIENCSSTCADIKIWKNKRKGEDRYCIWCETSQYLIILADRGTYVLFWTAYPVTESHTVRKLIKEYNEYKANAAQA